MKKIFLIGLGFIFVFSSISQAVAQESDTEEFTLEEITVTAQKREENQQKVPIAMEVISADDIKISGKNDLDEILANIPSAIIGMESDGMRISLRGMSDDTDAWHGQAASMPTVALNMDGVYSNRKDTGSGLYDLERVEVLYGPQSTLYASNSPGGIVNVVTANPKLDVYEGSGTIEIGSYDLLHAEAVMNAPISNRVALRAAFSSSDRDGYLTNGGDDEDSKSARIRGLFQPNEDLSFVITGEMTKSSGQWFGNVDAFENQDDVDDPWYTDTVLGKPSYKTSKKVYGRMDLTLGIGTLSVVPSYSTSEGYDEAIDAQMGTSKQDTSTEESGVEVRMSSSPDFSFTWIIGLNYYDSEDIMDQVMYVDDEPNGESKYGLMEEESKAIFTNFTYPVTDRFRATAGFRMSWDNMHVYRDEAMLQMGGVERDLVVYDNEYSDPDYKIGVEYDLSENSMIYADYSTSYRAQGMDSASSGTISTPPPEKLQAYTAGSKNRFLDNRIQLNASAFYYDYQNYAVSQMVTAFYGDPENPLSTYTTMDPNSSTWGDGYMMGFDLQTNTIITPKDNLNLSLSYLKTEWTDLIFDYYYDYYTDSQLPRDAEATIIDIYPLENVSYDGEPMSKAPEYTINAAYKHIFSLWNGGSLETQIEALYKGEYRLTWKVDDYPNNYQEAFYKIDLSANYIHPDGKWTLSGYVRNLENYAEKRGYSGRGETRVGNPRTYGAVLSINF